MSERKKRVTKRDVATCQLETAIKLFLEDRDLISAYTLCCAADGILEGIYKNKRTAILSRQHNQSADPSNIRFLLKEEWGNRLKPEYKKEGFRLLNEAQNFFKHADKDHDSFYEFKDRELTGLRIFMAIADYKLVFGEITKAMKIFFAWYAIQNPDYLAEGSPLLNAFTVIPDCQNLTSSHSHEELAAIGYSNLKSNCPELFSQADISRSI